MAEADRILGKRPCIDPIDSPMVAAQLDGGGGQETSEFNAMRQGVPHGALDQAAPVGTPVRAPADALVVFTNTRKGGLQATFKFNGNSVTVSHLSAQVMGLGGQTV